MRIVVLGAGIGGASAAYHLTRFGAEVYLIDRDAPGRATFAGAGIICPWLSQVRDPRYERLSFAAARYYPELVVELAAAGETETEYEVVGGVWWSANPPGNSRRSSSDCKSISIAGQKRLVRFVFSAPGVQKSGFVISIQLLLVSTSAEPPACRGKCFERRCAKRLLGRTLDAYWGQLHWKHPVQPSSAFG